ncbi:IS66 family insertion sequence element accessory protein TnpA [Acidithiobacillus sp. M4-SHS-6]|uniref:IS66 family insertion sequence element accessory protein TnpA n=1 Tax=Acidithiobacillus sp. M4-SHS-6 TaxID=3383024 RepID=UPI0039BE539F
MTLSRRKSPIRSAQAWQALLEEQRASSLTVAAFCRQVAISPASFYRWQGRLRQQGVSKAVPSRVPSVSDVGAVPAVTARMVAPHPPDFVDLGALADLTPTRREEVATPRVELRLELGAGLVLHLVRG